MAIQCHTHPIFSITLVLNIVYISTTILQSKDVLVWTSTTLPSLRTQRQLPTNVGEEVASLTGVVLHPNENGNAIVYRRITGGRSNVRTKCYTHSCNGCGKVQM
ncbi:hypothetical protein TNCT_642901 [Trichonephila clavata]|uniref:Uncharacterized protein n=1 Tax=Trichonephila clavata TaxID=2740835 RepID=A0A8X6GCJ1_TRICU|nr:hypothetical protein TNCT_642901 [Trichonephila clavata]